MADASSGHGSGNDGQDGRDSQQNTNQGQVVIEKRKPIEVFGTKALLEVQCSSH
jgi:hypothetical protein